MKRFILSLVCVLATFQAHAATWYVQNIHDGSILADFDFIPDGVPNPYNIGPEFYYFENVNTYAVEDADSILSPIHTNTIGWGGGASRMEILFPTFSGYTGYYVFDFSSPLTADGGSVALDKIEFSLWGNCSSLCFQHPAENYIATTTPEVPLPAAAWLFISAIGGLGILKRVRM